MKIEEVLDLFYYAEKFEINRLKSILKRYIRYILSKDNAYDFYSQMKKYPIQNLEEEMQYAGKIIKNNANFYQNELREDPLKLKEILFNNFEEFDQSNIQNIPSNYDICIKRIKMFECNDIELIVRDINKKEKSFRAHKAILSYKSHFFEGLLRYSKSEDIQIHHDSPLSISSFELLYFYWYDEKLENGNIIDYLLLLSYIDFYQIDRQEEKSLVDQLKKNYITFRKR